MKFDKRVKMMLDKLDLSSRMNIDTVRFDPTSGIEHRKEIIKLAQEAVENGEHFITRARLNNGAYPSAVADFYNIDWNTVYEVTDTEPAESIQRKGRIWRNQGFHFEVISLRNKVTAKD